VIIPTYNEAENVETAVDQCRTALASYPAEVIVVDDDSPDLTWQLARTAYGDADEVRVVRRIEQHGLASAVSRGFEEADNELCVVMDADLQHPPEKLPALVDAFDENVDIVVGSRYRDGGGIENWSPFRRFVSAGARLLAKLLLPEARSVSDPLSGFFAVRRRTVDGVELAPTGYKILLELLAKADYDGVTEVPYVFSERRRGESKLTTDEYVNFLRHIVSLRVRS
jgi:dolichol-phosphate mannosyltransferase